MKRASFLCLLALGAHAMSPGTPDSDVSETTRATASTEETATTHGLVHDGDYVASTAITAKECRVYSHIRDNIVSKLERRRVKGRCSFDDFRQRDA